MISCSRAIDNWSMATGHIQIMQDKAKTKQSLNNYWGWLLKVEFMIVKQLNGYYSIHLKHQLAITKIPLKLHTKQQGAGLQPLQQNFKCFILFFSQCYRIASTGNNFSISLFLSSRRFLSQFIKFLSDVAAILLLTSFQVPYKKSYWIYCCCYCCSGIKKRESSSLIISKL